MAASASIYSAFSLKHTGAVEAYTPNVLERHLFGVLDRALTIANGKYELSRRGEQTYEKNFFFVDWMRAEDRPNMFAFFFRNDSTFGTYFTKQFNIKRQRNTSIKETTVVFNAGFRVPPQYLPEVAPLVNLHVDPVIHLRYLFYQAIQY